MGSRSRSVIRDFNDWLGELPYRHKAFVPGNHDGFLEGDGAARELLSNATVLINEGVVFDGLRIWGTPITPLSSGAFGMPGRAERARVFSAIPKDIDVLVTHVPPFEICDHTAGELNGGCPELLTAVLRVAPKLRVFGHVHAAHGLERIDGTTFVNASLLGPDGDIAHAPTVVRLTQSA